MMSCCLNSSAVGTFFSRFARYYRKRYQRNGFEESQIQLIQGIKRAGILDTTILEIGCGVGFLHQYLLELGSVSAIGIDLSDKMIDEAHQLAHQKGLEPRVDYIRGDFVELAEQIQKSDVLILDKVVCCYPNVEALVDKSLQKTQRIYALTYPRNRWYVRIGMKLMNIILVLVRSKFRSYVHDPTQIESMIANQGYIKSYQNNTLAWLTQVFVKANDQNSRTIFQ